MESPDVIDEMVFMLQKAGLGVEPGLRAEKLGVEVYAHLAKHLRKD